MMLPPINERLSVQVEAGNDHLSSRVEGTHAPDLVVIAAPTLNGTFVPLARGVGLTLFWTCERGLAEGVGSVVRLKKGSLPLVHVQLHSSRIGQRRRHVRAGLVLDVELRRAEGDPIRCCTLDVSGGGLRATPDVDLRRHQVVEVTLFLPDEPDLDAKTVVVRGDRENGYAFRFVSIEPADVERLIQFVFAAHRREFVLLRRTA